MVFCIFEIQTITFRAPENKAQRNLGAFVSMFLTTFFSEEKLPFPNYYLLIIINYLNVDIKY